jgi:flagellar basal-body rod modification protein FlgD
MAIIQPSSALSDQYTLGANTPVTGTNDLGQTEFLELMMAQLEFQDPMKPMDNGEFLGQMAQFSTVTGIEDMQKSLDQLSASYSASQTLQSTQLVGQEVLIENNSLKLLQEGDASGSFELDVSSGNVQLNVTNSAGNVVRELTMGQFPAGRHAFSWDGMNQSGKRAPEGNYSMNISAERDDGFVSATVLTSRVIDSVEFGNGTQTTLNTRQGDVLTLPDIRQIRQAVSNSTSSSEQ